MLCLISTFYRIVLGLKGAYIFDYGINLLRIARPTSVASLLAVFADMSMDVCVETVVPDGLYQSWLYVRDLPTAQKMKARTNKLISFLNVVGSL